MSCASAQVIGTGSTPPGVQGWQRPSRRIVNQAPLERAEPLERLDCIGGAARGSGRSVAAAGDEPLVEPHHPDQQQGRARPSPWHPTPTRGHDDALESERHTRARASASSR